MVATNIQSLFYTMNVNFALARGEDVVGLIVFFDLVFFPPSSLSVFKDKRHLSSGFNCDSSVLKHFFFLRWLVHPSLPPLPSSFLAHGQFLSYLIERFPCLILPEEFLEDWVDSHNKAHHPPLTYLCVD